MADIINNLNNEPESSKTEKGLYQKSIKGGIWVFITMALGRILEIARLIVLMRLLTKHDFGLMGITLLMLGLMETFTEPGLKLALIQRKNHSKEHLDSAWTVGIIRSAILFLIFFIAASYGAAFFNVPDAKNIIRVYGLIILIRGFTNIGIINFRKDLQFNKQAIYQLSGTLTDVSVAISLALIYRNVWALVIGGLSGALVRCAVSYIIHPYRPSLTLHWHKTKQLWGFGKWILGSTAITFVLNKLDSAFTGKFIGVGALGVYEIAFRLSNIPAKETARIIATVAFPAYAKIQNDLPRLREAFYKVLNLTLLISFPIAGGIFILANNFATIFLAEKLLDWPYLVPVMQILVFCGLLRTIGSAARVTFLAMGKPKIATKIMAGQLILLLILIYPMAKSNGIIGIALTVVIGEFIFNIIGIFKAIKLLNADYKTPIKLFALPLLAASIMVLSIHFLDSYVINNINIIYLIFLIITGVIIYLTMIFVFDKIFNNGSWQLIKTLLATYKNTFGVNQK